MMGVAYAAILLWPIVVIILFRSLAFRDALIWSLVGGYLLLPNHAFAGLELPFLPPVDKRMTPVIAAVLMASYVVGKSQREQARGRTDMPVPDVTVLPGWIPRSTIGWGLLLMVVVGVLFTALTNNDAVFYGPRRLPPQSLYDGATNLLAICLFFLPVLLGRKFLSDDAGQRRLLVIMVISAMVYTLPTLWEVRMSPRINLTLYGFFPHESWAQHIRPGGWRPIVFLNHGLRVGIYLGLAAIAAVVLIRAEYSGRRLFMVLATIWLMGVLFMSQNLGAFIIASLMIPVAFFMPVRLQLMAAAIISGITLLYPILRGADLVPTEALVEMAAGIHEQRAGSLEFRFDNEDILLEHANERAAFGWGWWTRNWVYNDQGEPVTIADGSWIIIIGQTGWVGYLGQFGLLCIPLMLFFLRRKRYEVGLITSGLCLVTAANLLDLLPNSSLTPVLMLSVGALLGRLELAREGAPEPDPETPIPEAPPPDPDVEMTRYSRYPVRKKTRVSRSRSPAGRS